MFCLCLGHFFELSLYLPVVVLFFPTFDFLWFFFFLSALVEGIGDRIGVIKHKREVFVFLTSEKKAQAWEELLKDQSTLLLNLLWHTYWYLLIFSDFSRRFIHSGGFSYPSLHTWLRISLCGDLTFELDKVCGISNIFTT